VRISRDIVGEAAVDLVRTGATGHAASAGSAGDLPAAAQIGVAQSELVAVCNAHLSLDGRCARWVLKLHSHPGAVLPVTRAFLATMLGVRRAAISISPEMLQREGLILQCRGSIYWLRWR